MVEAANSRHEQDGWDRDRWDREALHDACNQIRTAPAGSRHNTVRDQAYRIGVRLRRGRISHEYAREMLLDAALDVTGGEKRSREMARTIDSGLAKGAKRRTDQQR